MTGAISEFDRREREDSARIPVCKFVIKLFKVVSLIFFEVEAEANPGGGAKPASYSHHPSYIHSPHTEQESWTVSLFDPGAGDIKPVILFCQKLFPFQTILYQNNQ